MVSRVQGGCFSEKIRRRVPSAPAFVASAMASASQSEKGARGGIGRRGAPRRRGGPAVVAAPRACRRGALRRFIFGENGFGDGVEGVRDSGCVHGVHSGGRKSRG